MHFPEPENQQTPHDGTVLDGELVYDSVDDNNIMQDLRFLVFDCLAHKKRPLITKNIIGRLGYAKEFVYKPYARLCREFPEDTELFPFKLVLKEMQFSYKLDHVFSEVLPNLRHGSDGLIFTCCETPYVFGTDETLLKWKPAEENSIDFRLHLQFTEVEDEDLPPHHPDRVYLDYDSRPKAILEQNLGQGEYEEFAELSITDAEWEKWKSLGEPLEHRIVEVARNEAREWKFLRFRDDKEDGNYTDVVRKVVASIEDSVKKEELIAAVPQIRENWKRREAERQQRKRGVTEKRPRQSGAEDVNQPQKRRVFDSRAEMQAEEKKGGAEGAEGEAEAEEEDDYEQPEYSRPVDEDYDEDE